MSSLPRLIVFDLDGTLIDSSRDLCDAVNAALAAEGRAALPHDVITGYIGDGAAMLMRRALGDPGDLDSEPTSAAAGEAMFQRAFRRFLEHYRAHKLDHTRPYDGVMEALGVIRAAQPHLPMAVLTNKPVGPSRGICDGLGLTPFFFQNYGGDSFPAKKPDPTGLLAIIAEAGALTGTTIAPEEVVMVGDSDVDVRTGRACGARTLGCTFGLSPQALVAARPDMMAASPLEWPALLGAVRD